MTTAEEDQSLDLLAMMEEQVRQLETELKEKNDRVEQLEAMLADEDRQTQLEAIERLEADWNKEHELIDNEREEELRLLQEVYKTDIYKFNKPLFLSCLTIPVVILIRRLWKKPSRKKPKSSPKCCGMHRENRSFWTISSGSLARLSATIKRNWSKPRNRPKSDSKTRWQSSTRSSSTTNGILMQN